MSNRNKRAGAQFETDTLKHLRSLGLDVERLPKTGRDDEGDLVWKNGGLVFVFELKNEKTWNMTDYIRQAQTEAGNYARARGLDPMDVHWAVIVKKRNAPIADAFVFTSLTQYLVQTGVPF